VNRIERPGLSHEHPARFVLVGSMNPEEGELRPQLLDRFGLAVEVTAPDDADVRAEIVRRRLAHDAGAQVDGDESDIILRARLAAAMPADLSDEIIDFACRLAVSIGAEGLRADLVLCRTAAAYAGWSGRSHTTEADVEHVAGLVLGHRRHRRPFAPPTLEDGELERALDAARAAFSAITTPDGPSPTGEQVGSDDHPGDGGRSVVEPADHGADEGATGDVDVDISADGGAQAAPAPAAEPVMDQATVEALSRVSTRRSRPEGVGDA
jgi:magnesium chelatase subunit D